MSQCGDKHNLLWRLLRRDEGWILFFRIDHMITVLRYTQSSDLVHPVIISFQLSKNKPLFSLMSMSSVL